MQSICSLSIFVICHYIYFKFIEITILVELIHISVITHMKYMRYILQNIEFIYDL